jgi:signal peptidase
MARAEMLGAGEVPPVAVPPLCAGEPPARSTDGGSGHSAEPKRLGGLVGRVAVGALRVFSVVAVLVALVALALASIGPRLGLYRFETVLSGSMRPAFAPGDLIIVSPEPTRNVRVGQVISYQIPVADHHVESHRVIRVAGSAEHPVIETRGDANPVADPWRARLTSATAWRLWMVIPKAGWLIIWLRQPTIQHLSMIIIPILLAVWWLIGIWRPRPSQNANQAA